MWRRPERYSWAVVPQTAKLTGGLPWILMRMIGVTRLVSEDCQPILEFYRWDSHDQLRSTVFDGWFPFRRMVDFKTADVSPHLKRTLTRSGTLLGDSFCGAKGEGRAGKPMERSGIAGRYC